MKAISEFRLTVAIAAREGLGVEARVLRERDPNCRWTHLGMAFSDENGFIEVIHADPHPMDGSAAGVRSCSWDSFCRPATASALFALDLDSACAERAHLLARQALGLAFDGDYRWMREDALHCTSMIWHVLRKANARVPPPPFPRFSIPLLGERDLILPSLLLSNLCEVPSSTLPTRKVP